MRKILMSLVMIVLAASVAVGATNAYFTSTATISEETFASGTITLNITGDDTYYLRNGSGVRTEVPVHFVNIKPGDTMRQWVTLHNNGTLPIDYLTVDKGTPSDPGNLLTQIIVSATGKIVGGSEDYAFFTNDWGVKPTVSGWFNNSDILDGPAFYRTAAGQILPGQDYSVVFDFTIPTTVGDSYQGLTASFNMVFHAEQAH
jgi:predicted ribosomally synthesized peptide with SipW-like signal peptide